MNSRKKYDFSIPLYYFFFFGAQCLIISYMNVYLEKQLGFTGSQLGLYTGITPLVPAAIIPFVGLLCDRTRRYKEIFLAFLGLALASAAIMSFQTLLPMVLLLGVILETARSSCISLADAQVTEYCAQTGKNYGLFRMGGSVGWVVFGMLIGFLTARIPLNTLLFPAYCILTLITLFFAVLFPDTKRLQPKKGHPSKASSVKNPILVLLHNKPYVAMLIITIVICLAGESCLSYSGNHLVTTMQASETLIGLNTAFCVVPEFFFFPAAAWLLKKYGFKKMYLLAAFGVTIRFSIYFFTGNPYLFLVGSLFHCLGSGTYTAVNLAFIHDKVDSSMFGTAVTLLGTVSTVARALFGYGFGYLYEHFGSRYIFLSVIPLGILEIIFLLSTQLFNEDPTT